MELEAITQRLRTRLEELRAFSATPGQGVTRFPFTPEARSASEYIARCMEQAGLKASMDNSGSVIGRLEGQTPGTVMIGSHLDSVRQGGAYDGIAGVMAAIETAELIAGSGEKPFYSLEVIATNDEEGSRFKTGLFTGKVMGGMVTAEDLKRATDEDGISVYQAMKDYGLAPDEIQDHVREDLRAFWEIHIEQGPVLEAQGKDIGVVDLIVGIRRALVTILGRADHIGTMPMDMRRDALEAASKVVANIGDRARQYPLAVATVGNFTVEPNIINIIPDKVTFTVDIRGTSEADIQAQYDGLLRDLEETAKGCRTEYEVRQVLRASPVEMDQSFRRYIEDSCRQRGWSWMHIVSGAGHDAQVFGARMPGAMIFVPSIGGRSHCPEELTDERTLAMAAVVARDALVRINKERSL